MFTLQQLIQVLKRLGPYAAVELLLPGGSILALLLWLYRRRSARQQVTPRLGAAPSPLAGVGLPAVSPAP